MSFFPLFTASNVAVFQQLLDPISSSLSTNFDQRTPDPFSLKQTNPHITPTLPLHQSIHHNTSITKPIDMKSKQFVLLPSTVFSHSHTFVPIPNPSLHLSSSNKADYTSKLPQYPQQQHNHLQQHPQPHHQQHHQQHHQHSSLNSLATHYPSNRPTNVIRHTKQMYSPATNKTPFVPTFFTILGICTFMGLYMVRQHPERFVDEYYALFDQNNNSIMNNTMKSASTTIPSQNYPNSASSSKNSSLLTTSRRINIIQPLVAAKTSQSIQKKQKTRYINESALDYENARDWFS